MGLEAHGLVKTFRHRKVVDDVNVSIQRGEVVGLLGPNGAGKTTSFYMIVGLLHAGRGPHPPGRSGHHRRCPCTGAAG